MIEGPSQRDWRYTTGEIRSFGDVSLLARYLGIKVVF